MIPPWVSHSKSRAKTGPSFLISVHVSPAWIATASTPRQAGIELPARPQHAQFGPRSRRLLEQICTQAVDAAPTDGEFEGILALLLASVVADLRVSTPAQSSVVSHCPMDNRIRKALGIIRESEGRGIELDKVARQVGLSRSHFYKRFKECVGASPHHAVDAARISWSVRMLSETEIPILEIADELGFSTQGHFTRFFVQHLLVPPTWYRDSLRRTRSLAPQ